MAASHTLPHSFVNPQISKLGVLTLYGYGIRVTMQSGHLHIEDGIGPERRRFRLPRVNHRLKRLVCIGEDGFITLAALTWLTYVGASFVMLNRYGKARMVTGPASPSESKLRRAQALALGDGKALKLSQKLISAKLSGQEALVREKLKNFGAADSIVRLQQTLDNADRLDAVRTIEARAAAIYWNAWRDVPILFTRKDSDKVPAHWLSFDTRHSPLTGGPRLSVNPANSLVNYTSAVAESECRLAAIACGLDPGIGFLHADTANRDSLALDLIEPIRPALEAWILGWLLTEPLCRSDFSEGPDGNCRRLSATLCSKLAETAPTWGRLVAPWAEYVARMLWKSPSQSKLPATRLTQQHKRMAKGKPPLPPDIPPPQRENPCRECGATIPAKRKFCADCADTISRDKMGRVAEIGRKLAHTPQAQALRASSQHRQHLARRAWLESGQTSSITTKTYDEEIAPLLKGVTNSAIASALDVTAYYATDIRRGRRRPHPRHWLTLVKLLGLEQ